MTCERKGPTAKGARRMRQLRTSSTAIAVVIGSAVQAQGAVTISSDATRNMSCANEICAPTAKNAVLNVGDLESLLASGHVKVTTTGAKVQARNIDVASPWGWQNASSLTLDAQESIHFDKAVSVSGEGGLSLVTNDGGSGGILLFGPKGSVTFSNTSSALTINGTAYTLVDSVAALAEAIAGNSSGSYALARDYDASDDGVYTDSPVATYFTGNFHGLGHVISNLSIAGDSMYQAYGFFREIDPPGSVSGVHLTQLREEGLGVVVGGLAGINDSVIANCSVSGAVGTTVIQAAVGGLAGIVGSQGAIHGTIMFSSAMVRVTGATQAVAGGLVGDSTGSMSQSYAAGGVSADSAYIGGVAGSSADTIEDSYSTARVEGAGSAAGGAVGLNYGTILQTYSTGKVRSSGGVAGGLIGYDYAPQGSIGSSYWDRTTSRITRRSQGAGQPPDDAGIKGKTTTQLQSGLPGGFDPAVWTENPDINGGLPYLIANPPPK